MTTADWLSIVLLAGLLGACGQGARVIVGLKKLGDAASDSKKDLADLIIPSKLIISLVIGFIAGTFAIFTLDPELMAAPEPDNLLAFAAAGYIGADFIEGFITRVRGDPEAPAGAQATGTDTSGAGDAGPQSKAKTADGSASKTDLDSTLALG